MSDELGETHNGAASVEPYPACSCASVRPTISLQTAPLGRFFPGRIIAGMDMHGVLSCRGLSCPYAINGPRVLRQAICMFVQAGEAGCFET